jgi:hypothetical protein
MISCRFHILLTDDVCHVFHRHVLERSADLSKVLLIPHVESEARLTERARSMLDQS